jgi:hypothetical protein
MVNHKWKIFIILTFKSYYAAYALTVGLKQTSWFEFEFFFLILRKYRIGSSMYDVYIVYCIGNHILFKILYTTRSHVQKNHLVRVTCQSWFIWWIHKLLDLKKNKKLIFSKWRPNSNSVSNFEKFKKNTNIEQFQKFVLLIS